MTGRDDRPSFIQRIIEVFLEGSLSVMLLLLSLLAGAVALGLTPREEDPQIEVPAADVMIDVPGATAEEVERQVTSQLEKLVLEIPGVEHVYSVSRDHGAVVTVRFHVGQDWEESLVKLHDKVAAHLDAVPEAVRGWVVKPVSVDDVAILNLTLWSDRLDDHSLRRVAEELARRLKRLSSTGAVSVIGILPGFWLLNSIGERTVAGLANPVFFTATAMIGMIALAGIAVRNAILLIEFVHEAQRSGMELQDALIRAGSVRFRAIFLTAGTAMLAALPITLDPIFSGLAWALIFGLLVSTAFTLVVIPVTYWLVYGPSEP